MSKITGKDEMEKLNNLLAYLDEYDKENADCFRNSECPWNIDEFDELGEDEDEYDDN